VNFHQLCRDLLAVHREVGRLIFAAMEGRGQLIAVCRGGACCPVKAVKAWLAASGITEGAIFRPVAKGGRLGESRLAHV
jgi:hypothetical protein